MALSTNHLATGVTTTSRPMSAREWAAAAVFALAVFPMSAAAICNDSVYCTANGTGALLFNTSGSYNSASGYSALNNNSTGNYNTANGAYALRYNSTGSNNTAMGGNALLSNTTGDKNTATGVSALLNNTTGVLNTANGFEALFFNTDGDSNTASGSYALHNNTSGHSNTAQGSGALGSNTTGGSNTANGSGALAFNNGGNNNTASGSSALQSNANGSENTASGVLALASNSTGSGNVAIGIRALRKSTTGNFNVALGYDAGRIPVTGVNSIFISNIGVLGDTRVTRIGVQGTQLKTFISGIRGASVSGGAAVVVSSTGQLGVVSSSRRYKEDIQPMGDTSAALMKLRPVTFRYTNEDDLGHKPMQYGLIAEEVAEVLPALVVRDDKGQPETVAYHVLPSLLLNEYQKQNAKLTDVAARAEQDHAALVKVTSREANATQELHQLRAELESRDKELIAIRVEMKELRKLTQQLVAGSASNTSVAEAAR